MSMRFNWTSNIVITILIIFAVFFGQQKYRQERQRTVVENEKRNLQTQLDQLEGKNREIKQALEYLNSESYKETVARQQLNLQKTGEEVYSFSEKPAAISAEEDRSQQQISNFQKWVNYFLNER